VVTAGDNLKLSGVLIEQFDGIALVGIGINVRQVREDFSPLLRGRVTSLKLLGSAVDRPTVATTLTRELAKVLLQPAAQIVADWAQLDLLTGTYRTFEWNQARYSGIVQAIDPLGEIVLELDSGGIRSLPALTTSLVKEE
jgi:biotin-(acetyl-CoA carboxylase) ligase